MSMLQVQIMPGDGAANPFTIPGTSRRYSCAAGAAIIVPREDADLLVSQGWVMIGGRISVSGAGPTSGRPASPTKGHVYYDSTVGALVIYAGAKTGWLHHATGASA